MIPKIIFTDIDGVWTDGGMYYDQTDNEFKKFNTSDSWGVAMCKKFDIKVAIITSEETNIVVRRANKLKTDHCLIGVKNKLVSATQLLEKLGLSWSETAFIGDDLNDYYLHKKVAISACPNNAPDYIKKYVSFVGKKNGGEGAFREFVEYLLLQEYSVEEIVLKLTE